jgi:hydrogenase-4 component F
MLILLIIIFIGFLNHFRAMYFGTGAIPAAVPVKLHLSFWCLLPMWMALVPLLVLGLWWPEAFSRYFATIAAQLANASASP